MAPRPRFQNLDPDLRRAILDAAAAEFAANGYDGASYNRIIELSGVSKGAMYYYFDSKADLYETTVRDAFGRFVRSVGGMAVGEIPGDDFWGEFARLNRATMEYAFEHPNDLGVLKSIYVSWPGVETAAVAKAFFEDMRTFMRGLLEKGQALRAIREDLPMELLLHLSLAVGQATDLWLFEQWDSMDPNDIEATLETLEKLYREVLGTKED